MKNFLQLWEDERQYQRDPQPVDVSSNRAGSTVGSTIRVTAILVMALVLAGGAEKPPAVGRTGLAETQAKEYEAEVAKSILELQQFRRSSSIRISSKAGAQGVATLVNLNPAINVWYVLTVAWNNGAVPLSYHLENVNPRESNILLDEKRPTGLLIASGKGRYFCDLFGADSLDAAGGSRLIYYPMCDGRIYLRNPAKGNRTKLEAATEFIRDEVWGGEKVITLFHHLLADSQRETADVRTGARTSQSGLSDRPLPASIASQYADRLVRSVNLEIALENKAAETDGLTPGAWYAAAGNQGIYVSLVQPNFIPPAIMGSYKNLVNSLDKVEASALCYLVAFDLDRFEIGFALGTEHPRVKWSDRIPERMKNPLLPGPDGIGAIAPLVSTGLVSPVNGRRTVSTFTGGFKRLHGAFRYGDLALKNHGNHYGFIENGVVFSKLQPDLATVFVLDDGSLRMKTWTVADNQLLGRIKHARQNGVPIIEFDETTRAPMPGRLVNRWGAGNWAGSEDQHLRTMRGGLALAERQGKRFLVYGVFSDATPSAMARVFQAYGFSYAMPTDMNALEHTYLALYRRVGSRMVTDHLVKGMDQVDQSGGDGVIPRFLGYPDNRDFFYVMEHNPKEVKP
jgi:hypothetical protein